MGETTLDRTFHFIMKHMVETGQAPFHTDIAGALGVSIEEGRKATFFFPHQVQIVFGMPLMVFEAEWEFIEVGQGILSDDFVQIISSIIRMAYE